MLAVPPALRNRQKVISAMRSGAHQQCLGHYGSFMLDHGPVCAVGLVERLMQQQKGRKTAMISSSREQQAWLGIDAVGISALVQGNDRGLTFPQLADLLEAMPYHDPLNLPRSSAARHAPAHPLAYKPWAQPAPEELAEMAEMEDA